MPHGPPRQNPFPRVPRRNPGFEWRDRLGGVHRPARAPSWDDDLGSEPVPDTYATLRTNRGDVTVKLFPNHAPATVHNFVGLATGEKEYRDPASGTQTTGKFYDGLIFHRVIDGFMIQGGDPQGDGRGGPGYTFKDEFHPELQFDRAYPLAMANAGAGTNASQFLITVTQTPHLKRRYTIFGQVADQQSRGARDAIATTRTGPGDRPVEPVVIESVTVEER